MPDDPYTITDLARLADVTPRTIRYYVAQGLLPSPETAGPSTRYGERHLLRLRLIRRLQRDHLPLSEIRARVERMGDEEVAQLIDVVADQPAPPPPAETLSFVRGLMVQSGLRPYEPSRDHPSRLRRLAEHRSGTPEAVPLPEGPPRMPAHAPASAPEPSPQASPVPSTSTPVAPGSRAVAGDRSTWERLVLTPDVELNVRRPLDRQSNKKVEQLARIARELFDDEA